jgi:prepilin-type N-terminal cleavage/methylation domain-containing protein
LQDESNAYPATTQGFTLLELLIVALLISISLAMSVPAIRTSLVSDDLAAGSRKVMSLITSSRSRAIMDHEAQLIFFDASEQKLWYQTAAETDEETEGTATTHRSVTLPTGIRIDEIKQANGGSEQDPVKDGLWVSKQGYMDKTIIRLINSKNKSISLLVSPFLFDIKTTDGSINFD